MEPYKKRQQAGWCSGKGYKTEKNRQERQFGKREVNKIIQGDPAIYDIEVERLSIKDEINKEIDERESCQ